MASAATPEMAETRKHTKGCGTMFTVYTCDVAEGLTDRAGPFSDPGEALINGAVPCSSRD